MKFPQYVSTTDRTVSIVGMIDKLKPKKVTKEMYIDGKGYIDENDDIWIYSLKGKPPISDAYPYFWLEEDGDKLVMKFSNPAENMRKAYHIDNMKDMDVCQIIEKTEPGEVLYDEEAIIDMNAGAAFYVPQVYKSDDFLKKIVKNTIISKGIDINRLKVKTEEKYILSNMKAALNKTTKMSTTYFICWMELLGCDFQIDIVDNGSDKTDPLKYVLSYTSTSDNVYKDVNGEKIECLTGLSEKSEEKEDE